MQPVSRSLVGLIFIVAAPAALAVLEVFHPHAHDLLQADVRTWLVVHYAQILLFPLAALALAMLVREQNSVAAAVCRVSLFVFAVSYIAFDTAAGVVTGILVSAGRNSGAIESWRPAVEAVWTHPIVGGIGSPLLAVLGAIAISVSTVAAAIAVRRSGASWLPVLLLGLSGFGISMFKTHAWPGGPLTFGGIAIACAWLLLERSAHARVPSQ
jgi:hypothetical protein